ncbi:MAG: phosphotransferase family protein [Novosphingobium sp.]|nr:phosphotransferase family protein [Novosphingobium sp.]
MGNSAVDFDRLAGWMDREGLGSGPVTDAVRLAGGSQNVLLRFTRSGRDYVLRRPPEHPRANSNETMRREARLLAALRDTAVPHAQLIAACEDESVIGAVFYLMEPIEGFNPQNGLPETHRTAQVQHRMGFALVEGLAALHALDPFALGLDDFGKVEGFLDRQVPRWQSQLDGYNELPGWTGSEELGQVAEVAGWLDANRPETFVPGILHGDYHLANVMYRNDGPELAAIVDWELATIGDPLIDLGWLLATWPGEADGSMLGIEPWNGFPASAELVEHYVGCGTRQVDRIDWYAIFGCYKLGILLEGTHARACAGKAPRDVGERLHRRAQWLFARARRWIGEGVLA